MPVIPQDRQHRLMASMLGRRQVFRAPEGFPHRPSIPRVVGAARPPVGQKLAWIRLLVRGTNDDNGGDDMSNESFYLTALKILLPVYSPDATAIRDPGLVKELAAYRSTNYTVSRHTPNRNIIVRIYEGQHTGELFKVKEAL